MDRLDSMKVLLETVNAGSLSAAARRLNLPLATVSRKVSELEAHLGTSLFTRAGRGLQLTDTGRTYAAACKRILEEIGEAERTASGEYSEPRGDLTLSAPIVFGRLHVLPVVLEFLKAYREINVRLMLADRVVDLNEDHIDLAVRISLLPDSSLMAARLGSIRRVVCASPAYLAARGTPQHPSELMDHCCVTRDTLAFAARWDFQDGNKLLPVNFHARLVVNTAEAAIDAALSSLGVTRVFSYQVAEAVRAAVLVEVLTRFEPPPLPVSLVYQRERLLPQKLRTFIDFAAPRIKARVAGA